MFMIDVAGMFAYMLGMLKESFFCDPLTSGSSINRRKFYTLWV